jgi:death-on-curing protein
VTALAASYAAEIVLNHPFVDGNKRTGFMLAATFLEINGLQFTASEESVVEATVALAAGALSEAGYANWLKTHSQKPRRKRSPPQP